MSSKFLNMILVGSLIACSSISFANSNSLPQSSLANNDSKSILTFHIPNPDNGSYYMGLEINGKDIPGTNKIVKGTTENTIEETQADVQQAISSGYEKIGNNSFVFYKCNTSKCNKNSSVASFNQNAEIQQDGNSYIISPGSVNITWSSTTNNN